MASSSFTSAVASALVLGALAFSSVDAHASPGITGYSGKPYNGMADTCESICHKNNSAPPTLTITVPSSVTANSKVDVTVVVAGSKQRTSMNAALSDGVVATKGTNTDIPFPVETPGEVGAVVPPPNGATGTYRFSFVAPKTNGPVSLWVAGMSASGSGTGGDGVAKDKRTIMVTSGTAPDPDAGAEEPQGPSTNDAGGNDDDGGSSSGTSNDDVDRDESEESESSSGSSKRARLSDSGDGGGCSLTAASVSPGSFVPVAAAVVGIARALRRRRDRSSRIVR
ncbi:MAG: hypothetical protein BGO98_37395 [Myxococcales bacterium 68-20]|nr:hypothetical protein [Myxococcales bacterium]OJY22267.1 MAG: hypothetical protein BGO98_37395 [Myxococcales bacterium 68-20]